MTNVIVGLSHAMDVARSNATHVYPRTWEIAMVMALRTTVKTVKLSSTLVWVVADETMERRRLLT